MRIHLLPRALGRPGFDNKFRSAQSILGRPKSLTLDPLRSPKESSITFGLHSSNMYMLLPAVKWCTRIKELSHIRLMGTFDEGIFIEIKSIEINYYVNMSTFKNLKS